MILSENLAALVKLKLGDMVELPTPTGMLRLPVVGIIRDLSNQMGAIFLERSVYIRYFQDDTVDIFRVYLKPGRVAGRGAQPHREPHGQRAAHVRHAQPRRPRVRLARSWTSGSA